MVEGGEETANPAGRRCYSILGSQGITDSNGDLPAPLLLLIIPAFSPLFSSLSLPISRFRLCPTSFRTSLNRSQ